MGKYKGTSCCCLKPKTTQHVAAILQHCHARRLPVVPQGGNTGLVGGSVPITDELVLSTSSMNRTISFDAVRRGPPTTTQRNKHRIPCLL